MGRVGTPSIAVIAFPYLYTSVLARAVQRRGAYRVDAPDLVSGDWAPANPYDVVITSLPIPREWGRAVICLPEDFADPLSVSVGDVTVEVDVDEEHPLEDLLEVVDVVAAGGSASTLTMAVAALQPPE